MSKDSTTAEEVEKLIKDAPNWNRCAIPNLDHDSAYDFVKYDWPKIRRYLRSLEAKLKIAREALEELKVSDKDSKGWYYSCEIVDEIVNEALSQLSL